MSLKIKARLLCIIVVIAVLWVLKTLDKGVVVRPIRYQPVSEPGYIWAIPFALFVYILSTYVRKK